MSIAFIKGQLEKYSLTPNRSLGQNFLADDGAAAKIADAACECNLPVIEIGPGLGALTAELMKRAPRVAAIEIDRRMGDILEREFPGITLIRGDAIKADLDAIVNGLGGRVSAVGNLPYYITTPICLRLLKTEGIAYMTLMMQKEAAERFFAQPGDRVYGPLTVLARYGFCVERLLSLSREAYWPAPEVDSEVLCLEKKDVPPLPALEWVCRSALAMRRKTLANNMKAAGISDRRLKEILEPLGIKGSIRGEMLTVEQFAVISGEIARGREITGNIPGIARAFISAKTDENH